MGEGAEQHGLNVCIEEKETNLADKSTMQGVFCCYSSIR